MIEERVTPGTSSPEMMQEHLDRYYFALDYVKGKTVLDIACGTGYGSHILSTKALNVIGADISPEAVNYALSNYQAENLYFSQCDALDLPFLDNSFDVVISFETIEHIKNYPKFISECRRILKPHGIFICSTPNSLLSSPSGIIENPYHVIEFTSVEFTNALLKEFSIVELNGQHDIDMFRLWAIKKIVKIKEMLGIKQRIRRLNVPSYPVSFFKNGLTKSFYMVAVCEGNGSIK